MEAVTMSPPPQIMKLAGKAVEKYSLDVRELFFIQHSENITFKAVATNRAYLLRIHSPLTKGLGTHNTDPVIVRSEMTWINSLLRNKLPVPRPVRNKSGDFVTRVSGVDRKAVNCSLLEWLEGDPYTRDMETEDTASQMGSLAGRMHRHASRWRPPQGFRRPIHNGDYFKRLANLLQPAVEDGRINYQDYRALRTSIEELIQILSTIRSTRHSFGLIHGDLHRGNFLYGNSAMKVIDFSLCAFGFYAYDLGTCLANINPALHPAFLEGYTNEFRLPKYHARLIEGFFIASHIMTFSYWLDDPNSQEALAQRVPYIAREYAAKFNRDERFWFPE